MTTVPKYKLVCCDVILKIIIMGIYIYISDLWWNDKFADKYNNDKWIAVLLSISLITPPLIIIYVCIKRGVIRLCKRREHLDKTIVNASV